MEDVLITNGSEVKALENGKVSGYLVRFSTENDPDITSKRDFFTAKTDFDLARDSRVTLYYDHGLDADLKKTAIGYGTITKDEIGLLIDAQIEITEAAMKSGLAGSPSDWIEKQLKMRAQYEAAIRDMASAIKLGWSSGTASHLVIREQKSNGANEIKKWPLGLDASLTPTPAEPRNDAVALKSVFSLAEYVKTKGEQKPMNQETKGLFADCLAENMSPWTMQDALYSALRKIQEAAEGAAAVGQTLDTATMVESVLTEYNAKLKAWAMAFVKQEEDNGPMAYMSATKSLAAAGQSLASLKSKLETDLPIEQHSDAVESAVVEFAKSAQTITQMVESLGERWEARTSSRIKAGRQLSASNKAKMDKACGKLKAAGEIMNTVHDELMKLGAMDEPGLSVKSAPVDSAIALQLEAQFLEFQTKTISSMLATAGV